MKAFQFPLQRAHLSHVAAAFSCGHAGIEQVGAVQSHQLLHVIAFGKNDFHGNAVALAYRFHHEVGFVGEAAGVQREDADGRGNARGDIEDHHAFLLKAGGYGE